MTIGVVQETGAFIDSSTNGTRAFGSNVTAGNLVVVIACKENGASDTFVAGDCTKSAGTATIDTPTLDAFVQVDKGDGQFLQVGIFSCLVTGSGSLTMQVAGGGAGEFWSSLSVGEYSGNWDGTRLEDSSTNSTATDNVTPAHTGDATSVGEALFIAGLQTSSSGTLTITPDGAFTQIAESQDGTAHAVGATARQIVGSGTTDRGEWALSVATWNGWSAALAVYREVIAAPQDQEGARFGADDGSESAHTFLAAQDTDVTQPLEQNVLLRVLVDATGDPTSTAYTLRYQKNGTGGYSPVPVGATGTSFTSPPTAPSATVTTVGTAVDPWTINRPAASTGDLIVFVIAWDDSTTVTSVTPPSGVNGETAQSIAGPIASNGTEMRAQAWYYIATGAWTTGTLSFDPSAAETCRAVAFVVPSGQFKAADPIGFANTRASAGTAETSVLSPTGTAESDDLNGRLYIAFGSDADAITAPGSNWNTINGATGGGVGLLVGSRDTLVSSSESITALTATIAGDSWATLCFVVKPFSTTVDNELYVATSSNITAGGEATTARLTPPGGKSTSDFVTGRRWDDENGSDSIDVTEDDYTEVEWCLQAQDPATNGDFFDFRVYAGSSPLFSYSVTPRWTIGAPFVAPEVGRRYHHGFSPVSGPWNPGQFTAMPRSSRQVAAPTVQVVVLGQVTELNIAQIISWNPKIRALAQVVEADTSQSFGKKKSKALGTPVELDIPQAISVISADILGQVVELNIPQILNRAKTQDIIQVVELNTAQSFTRKKLKLITQVIEINTPQNIGRIKEKDILQVIEGNTPQAFGRKKTKSIIGVVELDNPQTIVVAGDLNVAIGQVTEADISSAIAWAPKIRRVTGVIEGNTPQTFAKAKRKAISSAVEVNIAQIIRNPIVRAIIGVVELDTAQTINVRFGEYTPHELRTLHMIESFRWLILTEDNQLLTLEEFNRLLRS